jgi:hypothetical protein
MKQTLHVPVAPGRNLGAWVCLLALFLLWTPLWAAAWQVTGMPCCTGAICPAHGHGGSTSGTKSQSAGQENMPTECAHGSQFGMIVCQMSCCRVQDQPLTGAVIFVLPDPMTIATAVEVTAAEPRTQADVIARLFEPPSPPPRATP